MADSLDRAGQSMSDRLRQFLGWGRYASKWPSSGDPRGVVDDRPERGPATLYFLSGRRRFVVTLGQVAGGESVRLPFLLTDKWTADKTYNNTSRLSFSKGVRTSGGGSRTMVDNGPGNWHRKQHKFFFAAPPRRADSLDLPRTDTSVPFFPFFFFTSATLCCPRRFSSGRLSPGGDTGRPP